MHLIKMQINNKKLCKLQQKNVFQWFSMNKMIIFLMIICITNGENQLQNINHRNGNNNNDQIIFPDQLTTNRRSTVSSFTNLNHNNQQQQQQQQWLQIAPPASINYDNLYVIDFAWNLFKNSKTKSPIDNLVISPLLVQMTLSLLDSAATGQTHEQIQNVIRNTNPEQLNRLVNSLQHHQSSNRQSSQHKQQQHQQQQQQQRQSPLRNEIGFAAAIFANKNFNFNLTFLQNAQQQHISVEPVDFKNGHETEYIINNWAKNVTNHKIQKIFKAENAHGLRMLLTNAIFFRGGWQQIFNETEQGDFWTTAKLHKRVKFMKKIELMRTGTIITANGSTGTWIEIPYQGQDFSMILILPQKNFTLDTFMHEMQTENIQQIMQQLSLSYRKMVHLRMPKFSIRSSFSLVNVLLRLGLIDLFTINSQLPYLTENHEQIKIDDILQDSMLKVNEVGSVAAVVQTVSVVTLSIKETPNHLTIDLNEPFLSLIVDRNNKVPIFLSKVYDP